MPEKNEDAAAMGTTFSRETLDKIGDAANKLEDVVNKLRDAASAKAKGVVPLSGWKIAGGSVMLLTAGFLIGRVVSR